MNMIRTSRLVNTAALLFLSIAMAGAEDWKTASTFNGVDLKGLTPAQTTVALKVLRDFGCVCGCSMKVAECREKDPACTYSKGLSAVIVAAAHEGKSEAEVRNAAANSPIAKSIQPKKLLDDPIKIPIQGAPVTGPENARITLVEFSDFQCPYCRVAAPQLNTVLKAFPTQVKLIFKQFPLDIHSQAALAAAAAVAAQKQGKFWPMHDALFADRASITRASVITLARNFSLDIPRFTADLDSKETNAKVVQDITDGNKAGVEGTPTLFIDGQRFNGPINADALQPILNGILAKH